MSIALRLRSRIVIATLLAFGPLFFADAYPASAADAVESVAVEISIEDEIATTEITLTTAQETLTVATQELTATSELLDGLSPKQSINEVINTAIAAVDQAASSLEQANDALTDLGLKNDAYDAAVAAYLLAETNLAPAQSSLDEATVNLSNITSEVDAQQEILNQEQAALDQLLNQPADGYSYTTEGYIPDDTKTPSEVVSSTIQLPPMYDASTKIDVPFDIKLGDTVYEGQGDQSQIYVTSKGTITFGQGDHTFWELPPTQGIYVYHSDWMTAGDGAYATVTTTGTTLKVEWSLHRFGDSNGPLTNVTWDMTVNPSTGEWTGHSSISGNTENLYGGPNIGVRYTANGEVYAMTSNPTEAQPIDDQQLLVQVEAQKLEVLYTEQNYAIAIYQEASSTYQEASTNYQQASEAEQLALQELVSSLESTRNLTQQAVINVTDARTKTTTTYVVVSDYVASLPSGDFTLTEGQELQVIAPQGFKFGAVNAWYGAANDPQCGADVSAIINAATNGATTATIYANNSVYGDPCGGVVKTLYVTFAYDAIPAPAPKPTPQPTPTIPSEPPVPTETPQPSPTPVPTEPVPSPTMTPEPSLTPTPTPAPSEPETVEPLPSETPTPQPTTTPEPQPEPTPTEQPEPQPEPAPEELPKEVSPETLVELDFETIDPSTITKAQVAQLQQAAYVTFETAQPDSPEYEAALDALYLAAEADDIVVDEELAAIPLIGNAAVALADALNLVSNVGADMNPEVREETQKVTVAAVIVGQIAQVATATAVSGATTASASTRRK